MDEFERDAEEMRRDRELDLRWENRDEPERGGVPSGSKVAAHPSDPALGQALAIASPLRPERDCPWCPGNGVMVSTCDGVDIYKPCVCTKGDE